MLEYQLLNVLCLQRSTSSSGLWSKDISTATPSLHTTHLGKPIITTHRGKYKYYNIHTGGKEILQHKLIIRYNFHLESPALAT